MPYESVCSTSQREEAELGLYFYNARWYDPYLGRFTQADTISFAEALPNPTDAKAFDRYAYVYNNPVMYSDPSGHCVNGTSGNVDMNAYPYGTSGICPGTKPIAKVSGFSEDEEQQIHYAIADVVNSLYETALEAGKVDPNVSRETYFLETIGGADLEFRKVSGEYVYSRKTNDDGTITEKSITSGCITQSDIVDGYHRITCVSYSNGYLERNIIHETGHVINNSTGRQGEIRTKNLSLWSLNYDGSYTWFSGSTGKNFIRTGEGYKDGGSGAGYGYNYVQHPLDGPCGSCAGEEFADMLLNYVTGSFAENPAGRAREREFDALITDILP
jgi:RHS repeat-associated protein